MYPTTTGSGPFRPTIKFYDTNLAYVLDHQYNNEDAAYAAAAKTIERMDAAARQVMLDAGYEPEYRVKP